MADASWESLDTASLDREIDEQDALLARLQTDEVLSVVKQRRTELTGAVERLREKLGDLRAEARTQAGLLARLTGEAGVHAEKLAVLEADDAVRLDESQAEDLDTQLGRLEDWDGGLAGFDLAVRAVRTTLGHQVETARASLDGCAYRLTSTFSIFQSRWPDPNRGTGLASYEDYLVILTDLRGHGLDAQRQNWSRKVIEYSGDRLSVLNNSYSRARDEINDRLRPISAILRGIPFGLGDTALDIRVDHRRPETVSSFQARLRALAEGAMNPVLSDAATEEKFEAIRAEVARIRPKSLDRELLLDVRRHLKVTAQVLDAEGLAISAYDHIGDKSGGEAQMITAFICGAALRYQLGDQDRDRPRFAPVVLDEAFIKADGRYTARAVEAWRRLGFQLVVGAPEDKFNALEPSMGLVVGITKDHDGHSFAVPAIRAT